MTERKVSKFNEALWALCLKKQAFRYSGHKRIYTLVMTGKYAGFWTWDRTNKRMKYTVDMDHSKNTMHIRKDKTEVQRPLPNFIYKDNSEEGCNDRQFYKWHIIHKRSSGLVTLRWMVFGQEVYTDQRHKLEKVMTAFADYLEPYLVFARGVPKVMPHPKLYLEQYNDMILLMMGLDEEAFMHEFDNNPKALYHKVEWAKHYQELIRTIGVRKRQRFISRLIKHGPKKAMRASFPRAYAETINSLMSVKASPRKLSARTLSGTRMKVDYNTMTDALQLARPEFTFYTKELATQMAEKYGNLGVLRAFHYSIELTRARRAGLCQEYPDAPVTDPRLIEQWHTQISRVLAENYNKVSEVEKNIIREQHRQNWNDLTLSEDKDFEIIPLISPADFTNEGNTMHHCIGGYFHDSANLYAHVEHKGQKASVQVNKKTNEIGQLYGYCNQHVNDELRIAVEQWCSDNKGKK